MIYVAALKFALDFCLLFRVQNKLFFCFLHPDHSCEDKIDSQNQNLDQNLDQKVKTKRGRCVFVVSGAR